MGTVTYHGTQGKLLEGGGDLEWNLASAKGNNQAFCPSFSEELQFSLRIISITVTKLIKRKDLISKHTLLLS